MASCRCWRSFEKFDVLLDYLERIGCLTYSSSRRLVHIVTDPASVMILCWSWTSKLNDDQTWYTPIHYFATSLDNPH